MQSNVEILIRLYRQIVGHAGSADLPMGSVPSKGYHFSPMPTVNKLWAGIHFGTHQPDGEHKQSAILKVYDPGAGPEGKDAIYLEIQAFDPSASARHGFNRFIYEVPGREIAKIKECQVILTVHDHMYAQVLATA